MALVSVQQLIRRIAPPARPSPAPPPSRVFWWWEPICNLSCEHCDIGRRTKSYRYQPAVALEDKLEILRRLCAFIPGRFSLSFIVGEPFLHADLLPVVVAASRRGIITSVTTNGTLSSGRRKAEQIVDSGLSYMAVSLDYAEAAAHDKSRGARGTFERAQRSLQQVRSARERQGRMQPELWVNSIIMRDNLQSLLRLSDWVRAEGYEGHTFQPVATTDYFLGRSQEGQRWFETSSFFPHTDEALEFVDELERRKAAGYPIKNSQQDFERWRIYFRDPIAFGKSESCERELTTMILTHTGHVKMCPNARGTFGHALHSRLDELWQGRAARRARGHVYECESQCKILACHKEDFYF